jgi:hypothetical protein
MHRILQKVGIEGEIPKKNKFPAWCWANAALQMRLASEAGLNSWIKIEGNWKVTLPEPGCKFPIP